MNKLSNSYVEAIIKKAIAKKITTANAAAKLGITKQYVNRLKKEYTADGITAFEHGNKGKEKPWKTSKIIQEKIILLYKSTYAGFNFTHFHEKLIEDEKIIISYSSMYELLTKAGFTSPKKQHLRRKENLHPSRPRKEHFGEMLQIDASIHNWFGPDLPKATLHGAIDDSTGIIMGLYFDYEETLNGYYEMMWQILNKYGIPEALYGDNRTIFEFRKLSEKNQTIDRDVHINFKRVCMQLGIELITTSVSQAKGRVERLWGTLQSRLISELRLRNINNIDDANKYLPEFMRYINKKFALKPDYENSVFVPAPSPREIDFYLSTEFERIVDNGSSFGFNKTKMQFVDENGEIALIPPKTRIKFYQTRSKKLIGVFEGKMWNLVEVEKKIKTETIKKGRPIWKPGPNHPWKKFVINVKKGGNN